MCEWIIIVANWLKDKTKALSAVPVGKYLRSAYIDSLWVMNTYLHILAVFIDSSH